MANQPTIVSFSEVYSWICKRSFFYKYIQGYSPIKEQKAPTRGTLGHLLLQKTYERIKEGYDKESALLYATSHVTKRAPEGYTQELGQAWVLVDNWIKSIDIDPLKINSIEKQHFVSIDSTLSIAFTPDIIYSDVVEDYKFVERAWSSNKIERYIQLPLYVKLLKMDNTSIDRAYLRFFNCTTGKITHKLYRPTEETLDNILEDFLISAREIQEYKELPYSEQVKRASRTVNYTVCQWCDFNFPCQRQLEGKDTEKTFNTMYKQSSYGYQVS